MDDLVDLIDELVDLLEKLRAERQRLDQEGADPDVLAAASKLETTLEAGLAREAEWRERRAAQWRDPAYQALMRPLYGTGTVH